MNLLKSLPVGFNVNEVIQEGFDGSYVYVSIDSAVIKFEESNENIPKEFKFIIHL